jgi:sulfoxide reductase catalytic subunit YedY
MDSRRRFIKKLLKMATAVGLIFSPVFSFVRSVIAAAGRLILPKGTPMDELTDHHPETLDTRNLEPIPLDNFGVMGLRNHSVSIRDWRLEVAGRVKEPAKLKYTQILELPAIDKQVLLICPGIFANFGRWRGVSIRTLLDAAAAEDDITYVTIRGPKGADEKVQRFPIAAVKDDSVFLAYQVNGKKLPRKHGYPLRVVAADYYGFDWIKFVYRIEVDKI